MTCDLFIPTTVYHAGVLSDLHQRAFSDFWTEQSFFSLLSSSFSWGLIAYANEKAAGFVLVQAVVDEAEILTIAVDPLYQNQGWGLRLLMTLKKELISKGIKKISLEVAVNNEKAIYLYEKVGFLTVGRRPLYYVKGSRQKTDQPVDAVVMTFVVK